MTVHCSILGAEYLFLGGEINTGRISLLKAEPDNDVIRDRIQTAKSVITYTLLAEEDGYPEDRIHQLPLAGATTSLQTSYCRWIPADLLKRCVVPTNKVLQVEMICLAAWLAEGELLLYQLWWQTFIATIGD